MGRLTTESARDILERIEGKEAKAEIGKRKVTAFLLVALQGRGPRLAAEVIAEGEALGLNERALRRALKALGGWLEKPGLKTGWVRDLPRKRRRHERRRGQFPYTEKVSSSSASGGSDNGNGDFEADE